ncbi:MAG: Serine metalloprotease [Acidimicrobiales bacterium]|nr:Serine metalloprotease [Acidimicrobiales bacterium]
MTNSGGARAFAIALLVAAVVGGVSAGMPVAVAAAADGPPPWARASAAGPASGVSDQLIVTPVAGATVDAASLGEDAQVAVKRVRRRDDGSWIVKLPNHTSGAALDALAARWEDRSDVALVEPDRIRTIDRTPNDPLYTNQWHYKTPTTSSYGANLPGAWDVTTGSAAVTVAVLDTGYRPHVDLAGRFVGGYDFVSDIQIANDGNGRDSDASDPGDWITAAENSAGTFAGCGVSNSSWHGTHVAGTIGAASDNGLGVAGITWASKIVPVRVLGKCGGYDSDIIDASKWAAGIAVAGVPANPNPAQVINLSLGGSGACSAAWQTAVNSIVAAGTTMVIAAGNSNVNVSGASPGNCANVVTVAATGHTGSRAYYSNFGAGVEIAAPGGDAQLGQTILSTLNAGTTTPGADSYANYQGTSMATPHVVGVVALVKSVRPSATPAQVLAYLQGNATPFPVGSTCSTSTCGSGILNATGAVRAAASAPGAPGTPTATAGNTQASVTWTAPATDGGTPVTGYTVTPYIGAAAQTAQVFNSTALTQTVSGLANGTTYTFKVAATNVIGTGTQSAASSAVTPATVPGAPGTPTATAGNNSASVTWTAPTNGGSPVTGYTVTPYIGASAQTAQVFNSTALTQTATGLTNGTSYTFKVAATNAKGTGIESAASNAVTPVSPNTVPSAPGTPTATAGDAQVSLSWSVPASNGGSPVTGYTVTPYIGAAAQPPRTFASTASTQVVNSLANGTTYTFTVAATNSVGTSTPSAASNASTPAGAPGAPGAPSGTVGDATATLAWAAPASNNGSAVTGYTVTPYIGAAAQAPQAFASTATTQTLTGLANGSLYTFKVAATNGAGTGAQSAASAAMWPHAGLPQLRVGDLRVSEGAGVATIAVSLSKPATVNVTVGTKNGTALAGSDYSAVAGLVVPFSASGPTTQLVTVPLTGDTNKEIVEAFTLTATASTKAVALADTSGAVTLVDDDGLPALITVSDVASVTEGAAAVFTIAVQGRVDQAMTVPYTTVASTAVAGSDYTTTSGNVTFSAGEVNPVRTVTVATANDATAEGIEKFSLKITASAGLTFSDAAGSASIAPSDGGTGTLTAAPRVRIDDVRVSEGDGTAQLVVRLDQSAAATVVVTTKAAKALDGLDYTGLSTTVAFTAGGPTSVTVAVPIAGDSLAELDETFTASLTKPSGATAADTAGTVTILDDDGGAPRLRISDVTVHEGQSAAFLVSLDGPVDHDVTFTLVTANGTAVSGSDFGALSTTTITFTAGSVSPSRVVTVPILADGAVEATAGEKFSVKLTLATGAVAAISDATGSATILD